MISSKLRKTIHLLYAAKPDLTPRMRDIEDVLKKNPIVRFAAIIGPDGKMIKGGMRSGTTSLEPASKAEQLYLQWTTMHRSGSDWNKYLGRRRYILDKRELVHVYTFNVDDDHVLLVSTDPVGDANLGDEILDLLSEKTATAAAAAAAKRAAKK